MKYNGRSPGDWIVRTFGPDAPGIDIADANGRFLAAVKHDWRSEQHTNRPSRNEALANAELFADAPELARIVENVAAHLRRTAPESACDFVEEVSIILSNAGYETEPTDECFGCLMQTITDEKMYHEAAGVEVCPDCYSRAHFDPTPRGVGHPDLGEWSFN